jgi:hypothetical protein
MERVKRLVLISNISTSETLSASYLLRGSVLVIASVVQPITNKNMGNNIILILLPNFDRVFYTIFQVQDFV